MENELLGPIRHRITAGDREGARLDLLEILKADPDNAEAWSLLATLLTDPAEQVECYRQVLRIDPDDRQAATWLEALSQYLPEAPDPGETTAAEKWTLQCAQCGGTTEVRFVGDLHDKRAFCPHCGSQTDLPDTYQRVERRREQEQRPGGGSRFEESLSVEMRSDRPLGQGSSSEGGDLDQLLRDLNLPNLDDETLRQLGQQGVVAGASEQILHSSETDSGEADWMDRVLGRARDGALDDHADEADLEQIGGVPQPGKLTPEDIIRLAGGPLPLEDRRKCLKCGAVVSRSESRCPWCSTPLPGAEGT